MLDIFSHPKQFLDASSSVYSIIEGKKKYHPLKEAYPYCTDVRLISDLIREYIDTSKHLLVQKQFAKDRWGLTDIFKAADRRLGRNRLLEHYADCNNDVVKKILTARFESSGGADERTQI